jgi:hypothetical protein
VLTGNATGNVEANLIHLRDNDPDSTAPFHPDYGTFRFEVLAGNDDLEILALATLTLSATGAAASASAELQAEGLRFGDLVYGWADLNAFGIRGSDGDVFNALNMAFSNPAGLSQTRPPNPEPRTWGMLALGLGTLPKVRRLRGRCRSDSSSAAAPFLDRDPRSPPSSSGARPGIAGAALA